MPLPSPAEATQHLDHVTAEIDRLRENFSMRSKPEKQRMSALEALAPKLHRLVKGNGYKTDALSPKDTTLLGSLEAKKEEAKKEEKKEPKKKKA